MIKSLHIFSLGLILTSCAGVHKHDRATASVDSLENGLMCGTRQLSTFVDAQGNSHFTVMTPGEVSPRINTINGSAFMESSMFLTGQGRQVGLTGTHPPVAQVIVEEESIKSIRIRHTKSNKDKNFSFSDEVNADAHKLSRDGRVIQSSTILRTNGKVFDYFCWFVNPAEKF